MRVEVACREKAFDFAFPAGRVLVQSTGRVDEMCCDSLGPFLYLQFFAKGTPLEYKNFLKPKAHKTPIYDLVLLMVSSSLNRNLMHFCGGNIPEYKKNKGQKYISAFLQCLGWSYLPQFSK